MSVSASSTIGPSSGQGPLAFGTIARMPVLAPRRKVGLRSDDHALALAAVEGDGAAFALLYDRHERRAFNLAYRITGSEQDAADATQDAFVKVLERLPAMRGRDLDFANYLLTSVRHASYDVINAGRKADPSDELPESATPVGAAATAAPEDDPGRNVLLSAQQEEIRQANASLPPRQREALALRELEGLSYDEIAEQMGMNRNSVAQLISRARISLRDALRATALGTVAGAGPDCEKALPLIAMRDDAQLKSGDERLGWLKTHLAACDRCTLGAEAMAEAGASYRAWALVPVIEVLRRATIARAADALGHDWDDIADGPRTRTDAGGGGAAAGAGRFGAAGRALGSDRRWAGPLLVLATAAILFAFFEADTHDSERAPAQRLASPPATTAPAGSATVEAAEQARRRTVGGRPAGPATAPLPTATTTTGTPVSSRSPARTTAPKSRTQKRPTARRRPSRGSGGSGAADRAPSTVTPPAVTTTPPAVTRPPAATTPAPPPVTEPPVTTPPTRPPGRVPPPRNPTPPPTNDPGTGGGGPTTPIP